jgi:G3E family GTPase
VVDAVTDLFTARLAKLERVIGLLHPVAGTQSHSSVFVTEQAIRCADELILNKRDLYVPGHWEEFKASITARNPDARLWETTHARIVPAALLESEPEARQAFHTNVQFGAPPAAARSHYHPIATTIRLGGPLNRQRFSAWVQTLPKEVERAKGFFRFVNEPELHELQYAPPGEATMTPVMLLDEPEKAVVLIGRGYDVERCRSELLACGDLRL